MYFPTWEEIMNSPYQNRSSQTEYIQFIDEEQMEITSIIHDMQVWFPR